MKRLILLCLGVVGCSNQPDSQIEIFSDPQRPFSHRVEVWQASLNRDATVFELDPRRGTLVPATVQIDPAQSFTIMQTARTPLEGMVSLQSEDKLNEGLYFVAATHLQNLSTTTINEVAFVGSRCPLYAIAHGRFEQTGQWLPEYGFGFPISADSPNQASIFTRVSLDGRTAYVSSHCIFFGAVQARDTLRRIRQRVAEAPMRAWDFHNPMSIRPDFEASVQQFIEPALHIASSPGFDAVVQRRDYWQLLEDAFVAIFTSEIEAFGLHRAAPGIWGFPKAQLQPVHVALFAMLKAMVNADDLEGFQPLFDAYFMDPRHGDEGASCVSSLADRASQQEDAANLLAQYVDATTDWKAQNDSSAGRTFVLTEVAIPMSDSIVNAYGLLTNLESAIVRNGDVSEFKLGEGTLVRGRRILVHNHPSMPKLRSADLVDIPAAARMLFLRPLDWPDPEIIHPEEVLLTRGASAVFVATVGESEPSIAVMPMADVANAYAYNKGQSRIVVPCAGTDGKPYEAWDHFNDFSAPSEWRTPYGRVVFQPEVPAELRALHEENR